MIYYRVGDLVPSENDGQDMKSIDTGTQQLLCDVEHAVATITLNRPEKRNALSDELTPALREVLLRLETGSDIRCIVITGAGQAFCAGGDISGMGDSNQNSIAARSQAEAVADLTQREETLSRRLYEHPIPTIASLPGPAAGAGFSIALACDLRIAAASAFVTTGFTNVGLPGDYGGSWLLNHLVGPAKAKELYWLGDRISAQNCLSLGIVNEVVSDEDLRDRTRDIARRIASGPPIALRYMKTTINAATACSLSDTLALEAEFTVRCARTADHIEAVSAFKEKRMAQFTGE